VQAERRRFIRGIADPAVLTVEQVTSRLVKMSEEAVPPGRHGAIASRRPEDIGRDCFAPAADGGLASFDCPFDCHEIS